MTIEILTAKPDDAPAVSYIGRNAFRDAFANLFNSKRELEDYLEYTYCVDKIAESIQKQNNVFLLSIADGKPAGFVKLKKHSLNEQFDSVFQAELQKIYVLKQFHGTGVGSSLMQAALRLVEAIEPECLWLDTHVSNLRAIRFYEKYGFKKAGLHYFTIGSQTFEYHLMAMPVRVPSC
jgi:ribosomal protein S18 acetylase RimI-like enzyme